MSPRDLSRHIPCRTDINIDLFAELTIGYDPAARRAVLENLTSGWRLGVVLPPPGRAWAPSFMSNEARERVTAHFETETEIGRMIGPFTTPPSGRHWGKTVSFPVSQVEKGDGSHRTIFNMSYDYENSVNNAIPEEAGYTVYPTFEEVARAIQEIGLSETYFCLFDIKEAFRQLRIHPDDWIYQVISWQTTMDGVREWRIDLALPFGVRTGPTIFNDFGDALEYVLRQTCLTTLLRVIIAILIRYLDDHLLVARGREAASEVLDRMLIMMRRLNVPVKDSKTVLPTTEIKYTGFWWEPRRDLVTLAKSRWEQLEAELTRIDRDLGRGDISAAEIQSLAGLLCWASKVIPFGMIYIRELYSVVADMGMSSAPRALAKNAYIVEAAHVERARQDTSWWLDLCRDYRTVANGVIGRRISQVGVESDSTEPLTCELFSDMSGGGLGAHWKGSTLWGYAPMADDLTLDRHDASRIYISSGYGEAAGILMCLLTFLPIWAAKYPERQPGTRVLLHSDSWVAVSVWNSQRGRQKMRPYLRALERLCAFYNIDLQLVHIAGVDNVIADLISRLKDGKMSRELRAAFPEADDQPQPTISRDRLFL